MTQQCLKMMFQISTLCSYDVNEVDIPKGKLGENNLYVKAL